MAANFCWFPIVQWTVTFLRVLSETHGMLPQLNEEKSLQEKNFFFLAKKSVGKSKKLEAILLLKSSSFSAMKTVFWRSILQRSITMQSFVLPFAFGKRNTALASLECHFLHSQALLVFHYLLQAKHLYRLSWYVHKKKTAIWYDKSESYIKYKPRFCIVKKRLQKVSNREK